MVSKGCPAYLRRRVRPGSEAWGLEKLPRRVDGVSMRLFWPQKDCPAERYARTPRTLVARRVDVGYGVHASSRPRSKKPVGRTDEARKNPSRKANHAVCHSGAPRGPYRLLNAAAARLAAFR